MSNKKQIRRLQERVYILELALLDQQRSNINDIPNYAGVIKHARKFSGERNKFVNSCASFLDRTGFLTHKQIHALLDE